MPDTPANQTAYPQIYNQKPGLGFPIARVCTFMSLSCGAVLEMGMSRYAGKKQGELSLLRKMWGILSLGDILLTDALMSTWHEMLTLKQRGVDSVSRLNKSTRRADFRRGKRLGKGDHVVRWLKPSSIQHLDWATYKSLPDYLEVRETRILVEQPGFRTKEIIVVTTLLDPEAATKEDLASLYRSRWSQELDLRDIKVSLQMDVLRCKSPELVRKSRRAGMDSHSDLQPHSYHHSPSRQPAWTQAKRNQLQGNRSIPGSIPTTNKLSRAPRGGLSTTTLPAVAQSRCEPSRSRSSRSIRTS